MRTMGLLGFLVALLAAGGLHCQATSPSAQVERGFDGERAYEYALDQCDMGPRPPGSEAGRATGDYIIAHLAEQDWEVETQEFEYLGVSLRNVVGKAGSGPVVILGAHYDTRPVADRDPENPSEPLVGGNDGASGVAVLLELARVLPKQELKREVWLAFFDGEDSGGVQGWPWCVGSSWMAESLSVNPEYVIVVDMVGDCQQELYYEGNSDRDLRARVWSIAAQLNYQQFIPQKRHTLVDDHLPFVQRGIAAIDIIDFDYPYWHTTQDTCDKISPQSLETVGVVLQTLLTPGP
jgi:glutaminyl-peptide cyclotransferase